MLTGAGERAGRTGLQAFPEARRLIAFDVVLFANETGKVMNGSRQTGWPDQEKLARTWFRLLQNAGRAKRPVYERLPDKADILLKAGMTVIVDTAFLKKNDRMALAGLAERRSVPFARVSVFAPMEILAGRIRLRQRRCFRCRVWRAGPAQG